MFLLPGFRDTPGSDTISLVDVFIQYFFFTFWTLWKSVKLKGYQNWKKEKNNSCDFLVESLKLNNEIGELMDDVSWDNIVWATYRAQYGATFSAIESVHSDYPINDKIDACGPTLRGCLLLARRFTGLLQNFCAKLYILHPKLFKQQKTYPYHSLIQNRKEMQGTKSSI